MTFSPRRTGAVLGLYPIHTEGASEVATLLGLRLVPALRDCVEHVATDDPSGLLLTALRNVFRN